MAEAGLPSAASENATNPSPLSWASAPGLCEHWSPVAKWSWFSSRGVSPVQFAV